MTLDGAAGISNLPHKIEFKSEIGFHSPRLLMSVTSIPHKHAFRVGTVVADTDTATSPQLQ